MLGNDSPTGWIEIWNNVIEDNCLWAQFITDDPTITDWSGNGHTGYTTDIVLDGNGDPLFNNSTSIVDVSNTNYPVIPSLYTIEVFFRIVYMKQPYNSIAYIVSHKDGPRGDGASIRCSRFLPSKCGIYINMQGSQWGADCLYNTWNHFVIVRTATGYYSYLNGVNRYKDLRISEDYTNVNYKIGSGFAGNIQWAAMYDEAWTSQQILGRYNTYFSSGNEYFKSLTKSELRTSAISISRDESADSQRLVFSTPNVNPNNPTDFGYYSPYRDTEFGKTRNSWYKKIIPSKKVVAKMGYGTNITTVFTGEIDEVNINADPNSYDISVDCRDMACWLIDKQIKLTFNGVPEYYIEYPIPSGETKYWLDPGATEIPDISDIVKDLCMRAGFNAKSVIVEQTGIQLDPMWEKMSYMDCINDLCTASGFEFFVDEDGIARFYHQSDRSPLVTNYEVTMTGTDIKSVGNSHLVSGSDRITNTDGTLIYIRDTDYTINYENGTIQRIVGGSIADNEVVKVSYVYAAHVYHEGEDIYKCDLTISRRNLYGTIRVSGDGEEASATVSNTMWDGSRVDSDKILFADNQYLDTLTKVQTCANRLKADMLNRYIVVDFVCVANPWLQVGDCIMVVESSTTISEIYKIMSINFDLSPDGFTSNIKAFHVGYSPNT
jgi:hypothetical protein